MPLGWDSSGLLVRSKSGDSGGLSVRSTTGAGGDEAGLSSSTRRGVGGGLSPRSTPPTCAPSSERAIEAPDANCEVKSATAAAGVTGLDEPRDETEIGGVEAALGAFGVWGVTGLNEPRDETDSGGG